MDCNFNSGGPNWGHSETLEGQSIVGYTEGFKDPQLEKVHVISHEEVLAKI